jgi:hypothetical protein
MTLYFVVCVGNPVGFALSWRTPPFFCVVSVCKMITETGYGA